VCKNCRPDRLCAARLKARQFVIKITNHKKSFGIAPISGRIVPKRLKVGRIQPERPKGRN
jgi:hypothetical protein